MKPEDALKLIDQYLAQLALSRTQHAQLMQAVDVLNTLINKKDK